MFKLFLACAFQEITSLDAKEIAFTVLEQLPDVTNLDKTAFTVIYLNVYLSSQLFTFLSLLS